MLTPRLSCIYSLVRGKIIADIGTDHAYIPIELARDQRISYAYACDIREGPCRIARANIERAGFADMIEVRMAPGLSAVAPGEAEDIIIAGMGGILISDITASASRLILQPMNAQNELRRSLFENGFEITREDLACEGYKLYNAFIAQKGTQKKCEKEIYLHVPPSLKDHPLFEMLLRKKEREFTKIRSGLQRGHIMKRSQNTNIFFPSLKK